MDALTAYRCVPLAVFDRDDIAVRTIAIGKFGTVADWLPGKLVATLARKNSRKAGQLRRLPGFAQGEGEGEGEGDEGFIFVFAEDRLAEVAKILQLRRPLKLTDADRIRRAAHGRKMGRQRHASKDSYVVYAFVFYWRQLNRCICLRTAQRLLLLFARLQLTIARGMESSAAECENATPAALTDPILAAVC